MIEEQSVISIRLDEGGVRSAIVVKIGPKFAHLVWADDRVPGVRVNRVPVGHLDLAEPLMYREKPYPLPRAKRLFRRMGKNLGSTKSAREALRA